MIEPVVRKPLVLLLDDEPDIRESLGEYLQDCGLRLITAGSAEHALALPELDQVCVAVVDIRLGGMDGVWFIRTCHARHPGIRYLIHTGSTEFRLDEDLQAIGLSPADVLHKPVLNLRFFEATVRRKIAEAEV